MAFINRIITVSVTNTEDARRRRLLNILLLGVGLLTVLTLLSVSVVLLLGIEDATEDVLLLLISVTAMLVGTIAIYLINRYWSGMVAASLFLLLLTAILTLSDTPEQVATGRTLFLFTLPIIMASVVLRPYASFIMAALVSVIVIVLTLPIDSTPTPTTPMGFFAIALVSWLSSRSLEIALNDLSLINSDLDLLVELRTQELSEALSREQAELSRNKTILESIADGVIVFDDEGTAFIANPSITNLLDMTSSQIIGSGFSQIMDDNVSADDHEMLIQLINSPELENQNVKVGWGDNVFSVSLAPVADDSGANSGSVVVFRDFTAEESLNRMKSAFVSMASHELRTPLNAILGYSDMLEQGVYGSVNDEQKDVHTRIKANVGRMLTLVNNLLDSARMEAGELAITAKPFDVHDMLHDTIAFMQVLAEQRGLTLTLSVAEDLPQELVSDVGHLRQIIVNLVGNALKFTEEGTVTINAFCQDDTHWAVRIEDTGVGIPEKEQDTIFSPFKQVGNPITRRQSGSGLGLSIVKQLTELLGGAIQLESTIGVGSIFTITLPLTHP